MSNQDQNREALIRHIADLEAVIRRRNEQIDNQAHNARETQRALEEIARERDEAVERAEKYRRAERDHRTNARCWMKDSEVWQATAEEWERRALAAESRPVEVTDEMVYLGAVAGWRGDVARPSWTFEDISAEDQEWYLDNARAILAAALTAPPLPTRPEGAEDIEALIRDLLGSHPGDWYGDLADHLAAHLTDPTRKEA